MDDKIIFWGFEINAGKVFSAILIISETFMSYLKIIKIFTDYIHKNIRKQSQRNIQAGWEEIIPNIKSLI